MARLSDADIEDIKQDICDNYCKMPAEYLMQYKDSEEAMEVMWSEVCGDCPLNRL